VQEATISSAPAVIAAAETSAPIIPAVSVDSAAQCQILAGALKAYYSIDGDLELTAVTPLSPLTKNPATVEILSAPETPQASMLLKARYMSSSDKVGEVAASFHAQWKVSAFVPRCQLARGSALHNIDFDLQIVDRLALKSPPVDPSTKLAEYELASPLSAGMPLTWNFLKIQPLVHKGALVDVIAEEGAMRITTRAIATQDAGRGQQVIMKNITTNRPFEAYVINENVVQIRF